MPNLRRWAATSEHRAARICRWALKAVRNFSLPLPGFLFRPALIAFVLARAVWHFVLRVFFCEPFFKAYCSSYGRNLHTGVFLHWIQGKGDILIGDDVLLDGKSSIAFAARFADRPTLQIGNRTGLGHGCTLVIGQRITIGNDCRIAADVVMRDSAGHASDPEARRAGLPPSDGDVRPIRISDNVWIGGRAYIGPGVTIGEGSIVAAQAVVLTDVAPYTVVAGNPARRIGTLSPSTKHAGGGDSTEE